MDRHYGTGQQRIDRAYNIVNDEVDSGAGVSLAPIVQRLLDDNAGVLQRTDTLIAQRWEACLCDLHGYAVVP